jgi:hypothetical protein
MNPEIHNIESPNNNSSARHQLLKPSTVPQNNRATRTNQSATIWSGKKRNTQATRAQTKTHTNTQTNEEKEKTGKQNEKQNQELPKRNITATALQAAHLSATKQTAGKVHRCNRRRSSSGSRQTANLAPALLVRIMASNSRALTLSVTQHKKQLPRRSMYCTTTHF